MHLEQVTNLMEIHLEGNMTNQIVFFIVWAVAKDCPPQKADNHLLSPLALGKIGFRES